MSDSDNEAEQLREGRPTAHSHGEELVFVPAPSSSSNTSRTASLRPGNQSLVFSDPVAFKYFEEDSAVTVLERRRRLQGYEVYIVEQWACSRTHPTYVVTTYTGDPAHSITVGVVSIPKDENSWSPRLKVYFRAMIEYHAREQETPLGLLMVTSLSVLPSSLTVILIPDGDVRKHREDFIVNENLKRLGCAGRSALNLQHPQPSTVAKFHHLFRTRDTLGLYPSVVELVKLCQVSLSLYGKLAPVYADGLLCDITEQSITDWWSDIGTYIYNIEPSNNPLDPSTVSALIGLLMGAFNRLKAFGAPVSKDVFDISSTKRGIGYFQKSQRMDRTRRLDRHTLMKLHKATAKTASGEGWTVPRAVKSTVAELSGKGGEMVMGMVGAREKAGIAEVETLDIESLAELVTGAKAKWLWQGKVARPTPPDASGPFSPSDYDTVFSTDDQGNYIWTSTDRDPVRSDHSLRKAEQADNPENRTGFERFKDAVGLPGLRTHQPKQSKDYIKPSTVKSSDIPGHWSQDGSGFAPSSQPLDAPLREPFETAENTTHPDSNSGLALAPDMTLSRASTLGQVAPPRRESEEFRRQSVGFSNGFDFQPQTRHHQVEEGEQVLKSDPHKDFLLLLQGHQSDVPTLRRAQSSPQEVNEQSDRVTYNDFPRCLSFSAIETAILNWNDNVTEVDSKCAQMREPHEAIIHEQANAFLLSEKADKITHLERATIPRTQGQVQEIDDLHQLKQRQRDELNAAYHQRLEEHQSQKATVSEVVADERQGLHEILRRVEMLEAKLDYEVDALDSRIEEVEDGVREFQRSVQNIEARVDQLVDDNSQRGPPWWLILGRFFTAGKA